MVEEGVSEEVEITEPAPVYPVSVKVTTQPELDHNFGTTSHFCVKLEVEMEGMEGVLVQYRLERQEKGARISGNTGAYDGAKKYTTPVI